MGLDLEFARRQRVERSVFPEQDRLVEHCAVFGVYNKISPAAPLIYIGLSSLQHRGQETSGIATHTGSHFATKKGDGLVSQLYTKDDISQLSGSIGIGHNRYATVGGLDDHAQPVTTEKHLVTLAHNGTLPQTHLLETFLTSHNVAVDGLNDSEMMQRVLEYHMGNGHSIEDAIIQSYSLFTGAFSVVIATEDKLIGLKDRFGIRPLALGETTEGFVLSSETCGIDAVNGHFLREVRPGEMVVIDANGVKSTQLAQGEEKLDIFELVYFARPDSILYGRQVADVRREMGKELAKERKIEADIVIAVPNSAIPAAAGYAEASGIRYEPGALIKDSYTHRTFINPSPEERIAHIRRKFTPISLVLAGKKVIVIDDSIVRGPTSKELVHMLRNNGASKVHFISASPPVKYPDFYGIATPTQQELIASYKTHEEIREYIGADSLQYLSYEGLIKATGLPEEKFNTSCFTGRYPIDIGEHARRINFSV